MIFHRFLGTLPRSTRQSLYTGGALFLFGALVIETMGGWFDPLVRGDNLTYIVLATIEEGCELAGAAMILRGLIGHIEAAIGPVELSVRP